MTEPEWLTSVTPWEMIDLVRANNTRKLKLFVCACCCQVLNPFSPPLVERAVTASEMFADGEMSAATLGWVREAVGLANAAARGESQSGSGYLCHLLEACLLACGSGDQRQAAQDAALATARAAADVPWPATGARPPEFADELAAQADLLRDIFGNPFRSAELKPDWLTADVLALARGIYADRAFDRMPILADALQDAGCEDANLLAHCREHGNHVRGCWVIDRLLGRV